MNIDRRATLQAAAAATLAGLIPRISYAESKGELYDIGHFGNARIIHQTDTHAQAEPVFFREPSTNIGVGSMEGRPPHLVGNALLNYFKIPKGGARAYSLTFLDFEEAAHRFGRMGGFAHIKTLVDRLRNDVGGANSILLDGGDLWQGSGLANLSNGMSMVELSNLLGIDAMTGHWEFTYGEEQLRKNIAAFKGRFLAQNVFLTDEASFNGAVAFDTASNRAFQSHLIREIGGRKLAVIGQAFPYVPIAHPQRFVPNWTFGIREDELQKLVSGIREGRQADAIVLLSHNGMDADLKLASRVTGIDAILGGHTHDAVPVPTIVSNPGGKTIVANGGSNGKFLGVLDLDIGQGRVNDFRYALVPIFSNVVPADKDVATHIADQRAPHAAMLDEKLANVDELLYRRGNFSGPVDQMICDALLHHSDAQIALSPGFRWGPSVLAGSTLTMGDLLAQTATTYPDVYTQMMTGEQIKALLEDVCDNLFNKDPYRQQGGDMIRVGGMTYTCAPNDTMGSRISDLKLDNGEAVEAGKPYKVAGWASVSLPQNGTPIWEVVAGHLRSTKNVKGIPSNRVILKGVSGNPGIEVT